MRQEVFCETFLDLYKDHDTLDYGQCLDILAAYGVGTQYLSLLQRYWYSLPMVTRVGGPPFKVQSGMTQGYPISPTISNVVAETVLCNWFSVVTLM